MQAADARSITLFIVLDHSPRWQSPDGRSLAIGTETGHVTVIDVASQSVVATHNSHAMCVRALSWSPDSQVSPQ